MSTTLAKKETLQRKWYVVDAAGKPLGRSEANLRAHPSPIPLDAPVINTILSMLTKY